jgi:hypothetical protein
MPSISPVVVRVGAIGARRGMGIVVPAIVTSPTTSAENA